MKITAKHYAEAFLSLAAGKNDRQIDTLARECIAYFAKRGKTKLLRAVIGHVAVLLSRRDATRNIAVTVASEQKDLLSHLKKSLASLGGAYDLSLTVEPSIIGGMIVKVDDVLVDASISNQLRRLRAHIKSS